MVAVFRVSHDKANPAKCRFKIIAVEHAGDTHTTQGSVVPLLGKLAAEKTAL